MTQEIKEKSFKEAVDQLSYSTKEAITIDLKNDLEFRSFLGQDLLKEIELFLFGISDHNGSSNVGFSNIFSNARFLFDEESHSFKIFNESLKKHNFNNLKTEIIELELSIQKCRQFSRQGDRAIELYQDGANAEVKSHLEMAQNFFEPVKKLLLTENYRDASALLTALNRNYIMGKDLEQMEKMKKDLGDANNQIKSFKDKIDQLNSGVAQKSSEGLAEFFAEEIERIAGKDGLPRSYAPRNDGGKKEKSPEVKKLERKVLWLRVLVYAIPAGTIGLILYSRHCEPCASEAWQSNALDWHFWLALFSLFLVSSYHLTQSIRELNVLKNMAASYRHRYIVAKTFISFVDNIANTHADMKDSVTKEAALAMFKRDSSGYLSKNQMEPSNTPVQEVTKIFKQ